MAKTMTRCLLTAFSGALLVCGIKIDAAGVPTATAPYLTSGIFTEPMMPSPNGTVMIGVRVPAEGIAREVLAGTVSITAPDGSKAELPMELRRNGESLEGSAEWIAGANGVYSLTARLGNAGAVPGGGVEGNLTTLDVPVVLAGRRPHLVWFRRHDYLRWRTLSAGSAASPEKTARWHERGVKMLAWHGRNKKKPATEQEAYEAMVRRMERTPHAAGLAFDELGLYPTPESREVTRQYILACRKWYQEHRKNRTLAIWHAGTLYPEEAALYRGACDLVLIESYLFYWKPRGLGTERGFDLLDMSMVSARQTDLLVPTGKGTQAITTVDVTNETFDRGAMEGVFRHLRRQWPEMRGIGFFGSAERGLPRKDATEKDRLARAKARSDNQYIDRLCYDYFVKPVLTFHPGDLRPSRDDAGARLVTVVMRNIGAMDAGRAAVALYDGHEILGRKDVKSVPAGNSSMDNFTAVEFPWTPASGVHRLRAVIESADDDVTVLDPEITEVRFIP